MSNFPFDYHKSRARPRSPTTARLADRLRQRSTSPFSNHFVQDLKEELDKERKMFFDDEPGFGSSRNARGRFPFGTTGGGSPRSAFDDLASRHPMFAQHMRRGSPWEEPFAQEPGFPRGAGIPRDRHNSGGGASTCSSAASASSGSSSTGEVGSEHVIPIRVVHSNSNKGRDETQQEPASDPERGVKKAQQPYSTQRNTTEIPTPSVKQTVRDLEDSLRGQRAQSAPPSSTQAPAEPAQRFVSKLSIDPHLPKPPTASPPPSNLPNMTEVGGNSSKSSSSSNPGPGNIRHIPIFVEGRQQTNGQGHAVPDSRSREPSPRPGATPTEQPPASDHEDHSPPKKPTLPKDPLEVIQLVSQDVLALQTQVEAYSGTSRKAKDYLYLDEMLTRDLIKLDVIETEGREDVRQARRDCIKLIQGTISKLEAKVPLEGLKTEEMDTALVPYQPNNSQVTTIALDPTSGPGQSTAEAPSTENTSETPMEVSSSVEEPIPAQQ